MPLEEGLRVHCTIAGLGRMRKQRNIKETSKDGAKCSRATKSADG